MDEIKLFESVLHLGGMRVEGRGWWDLLSYYLERSREYGEDGVRSFYLLTLRVLLRAVKILKIANSQFHWTDDECSSLMSTVDHASD